MFSSTLNIKELEDIIYKDSVEKYKDSELNEYKLSIFDFFREIYITQFNNKYHKIERFQ